MIIGRPPPSSHVTGGFTVIDLLTGATTTVFPTCQAVQAQAHDDGWLVRASCRGGSVAAVVDDAGALVATEGLLVADQGDAVSVGDNYLVFVDSNDEAASQLYAVADGSTMLLPGQYCHHTDLGASVICQDKGKVMVTTLTPDGVVTLPAGPSVKEPYALSLCSVGGHVLRQVTAWEPDYSVSLTIEPGEIPVDVGGLSGSDVGLACPGAGGGIAYLAGAGGVWALDTSTGQVIRIFSAPSEVFPVTDDWPYEGRRVVIAMAAVGGSSFVELND